MNTNDLTRRIRELITPHARALGLDIWGLELVPGQGGQVLRVYLESAQGVNIDQCAEFSRSAGVALDVEDMIPGRYSLEVSSPGMERPFFELSQLAPYTGRKLDVRLGEPLDGRKRFRGTLLKVEDDAIVMEVDGTDFEIPWAMVSKCNLRIEDWAEVQKKAKPGKRGKRK